MFLGGNQIILFWLTALYSGGCLQKKWSRGYKFGEGDNRDDLFYFGDKNIRGPNDFLTKIKSIADEKNTTLAQLVLRWTMDRPGITITLVGARNELDKLELVK